MSKLKQENVYSEEKSYRYRLALTSMNVGIWEWNIQTNELLIDDRWAEIIGYKVDELIPLTIDSWRDLIHPDDKEIVNDEIAHYLTGESESYEIEVRMKHKNGSWVWVLSRGKITERDALGKPIKIHGAHLDLTEHKNLDQEKLNSQYLQLIENAPFPIILASATNGILLYGNKRAESQFGFSGHEGVGLQTMNFYVNIEDRNRFLSLLNEKKIINDFEVELYNYLKTKYWALMSASFTFFENELAVLVTINDITERKIVEKELEREKEKYRLLADSMADVIWVYNLKTNKFSYISPSIFNSSGYTVEEAMKLKFSDTLSPESLQNLMMDFERNLEHFLENPELNNNFIIEYQQFHKNGGLVWVETSYTFRNNELNENEVICSTRNIEERKRIESRIEYLNLHEANSGLLNKIAFRLFEEEWNRLEEPDYNFSIIYIDIDNFSKINDSLGHYAGDQLILEIAAKIKKLSTKTCKIYHYDGDEFLLVVFNNDPLEISIIAKQLAKVISQQIHINEYTYLLTASIGYDIAKIGTNIETVFKNATTALYVAKGTKNTIKAYSDEMADKQTHESRLENDLHYAIERNELELYYQPIFDVNTGRIEQAEALIRWNHPEFGLVSPIDFIPLAEKNRLIIPITDWVIHQACQTLALWDQEKNPLTVSINISFVTIDNRVDELYSYLQQEILSSGIKPEQLKLEVTETSLVQDSAEIIRVFIRLKELGLSLALDDFGTGYSSFAYLKSLPLDIVKIDRSLVRNIEWDVKGRMIVESMITILHGLNLSVVIEGIENVNQFEILRSMKADSIQGYLFSRPLKLENFKEYYETSKNPDAIPVHFDETNDFQIILHWRSEWNSGNPKIDDQHRVLMKLAAELERSTIMQFNDQSIFNNQVNMLLKEIEMHFKDEELILKQSGYPQLYEHEIEHQRLLNQFIKLWSSFEKNEVDVYAFVKFVVRDVIWDHLLREDVKFFPYVSTLISNKPINYFPHYQNDDIPDELKSYRDLLSFNLYLQSLLTDISTTFISFNIKDFDAKINSSLKRCGKQVEADRVYIFEYDWAKKVCSNTYEWCKEGIIPQITELQDIPLDFIPDWVNAHIMGETIYIPDVLSLEENSNLRLILEPQGIQSLLTVPMMIENVCFGFIGFDSVKSKHAYSDYERTILREVSNVLLVAFKRKSIEEQLLEEKEFYEMTVSSLDEAIILSDYQNRITLVNKGTERLLNKAFGDVRGKDIRKIFQPINLINGDLAHIDWDSIYTNGLKFDFERNTGFIQSDGSLIFIDGTITPIITNSGTKKGAIIHFKDVTIEYESIKQIDAFLEVNTDLLCVANLDGYFLRVNQKFTDVLGYSIEELENKLFLDYVHPEDVEKTLDILKELPKISNLKGFVNRYRTISANYITLEWDVKKGYGRLIYASATVI